MGVIFFNPTLPFVVGLSGGQASLFMVLTRVCSYLLTMSTFGCCGPDICCIAKDQMSLDVGWFWGSTQGPISPYLHCTSKPYPWTLSSIYY